MSGTPNTDPEILEWRKKEKPVDEICSAFPNCEFFKLGRRGVVIRTKPWTLGKKK